MRCAAVFALLSDLMLKSMVFWGHCQIDLNCIVAEKVIALKPIGNCQNGIGFNLPPGCLATGVRRFRPNIPGMVDSQDTPKYIVLSKKQEGTLLSVLVENIIQTRD